MTNVQLDPLVSVVIPSYNRESLIAETVESVLQQSYSSVEIIVVDDGSTDGTLAVLGRYNHLDNFTLIESKHVGASAARNIGIREASGDLIAFLDSDDLYHIKKLELSVAALQAKSNAVLVHSSWVQWEQKTNRKEVLEASIAGDARDELLRFGRISTSTIVAHKTHLSKIDGFDESMWLVEDYDLWCRLAAIGPFVCIEQPLTTVRIHPENSIKEPDVVKINQLAVIDKYFGRCPIEGLGTEKFYIANSLYAVAALYFRQGNYPSAMRELLTAFKMDWRTEFGRILGMAKFVGVAGIKGVFRKARRLLVPSSRRSN